MPKKKFIALARVSSREQEREGFSLDVQVDALTRWAAQHDGEIVKLWRIAETASKSESRKTFKEMLAYAKKHARSLDGLLFYKVDRAVRNLFDYVELERLESEYDLRFFSISQPTENTPAGRMQRRILASMASFYTEQQGLDVKQGLTRRVQEGWFHQSPYGYFTERREGRSIVLTHPVHGPKVTRIFELYAYHQLTIDGLIDRLAQESVVYKDAHPRFPRSTVHAMLRDRAYIGEVSFRGQWHPGKHEPLVDRQTWERVQTLLGGKTQRTHELTFAGNLIQCGHCGRFITGESITKKTTGKEYLYYRCTANTSAGHPRVRLTEAKMEQQFLQLFSRLRIEDEQIRQWFAEVLQARTQETRQEAQHRVAELRRQLSRVKEQQGELLNLRLQKEIDADTFAAKSTELRDREAHLSAQVQDCGHAEGEADRTTVAAFELSQRLQDQWVTSDYAAKRRVLEILLLNCKLDGATLVCTMRKPFNALAEGQSVQSSGEDRTPVEQFACAVAELSSEVRALILPAVPQQRPLHQIEAERPEEASDYGQFVIGGSRSTDNPVSLAGMLCPA